MSVLGVAVIGQSPRDEIAAAFSAALPAGAAIKLRGCLDGMTREEIGRIPPRDGADTLYTRLPCGSNVLISKSEVVARAPATLEALRRDGAAALVLNCTGAFPPMAGDAGVIFPSRLLSKLAEALLPAGRIAILAPVAEQCATLEAKWRRDGVDVASAALSPSEDADAARAAVRSLRDFGPDLVVMDCMSYRPEHKHAVSAETGAPTLLAMATVSAVVGALLA